MLGWHCDRVGHGFVLEGCVLVSFGRGVLELEEHVCWFHLVVAGHVLEFDGHCVWFGLTWLLCACIRLTLCLV